MLSSHLVNLLKYLMKWTKTRLNWEEKLPVVLPVKLPHKLPDKLLVKLPVKMVDFWVLSLPKDCGIVCIVEDNSLDIG